MRDVGEGGCRGNWETPNHLLFQVGHAALLIGLMAPHGRRGLLVFHAILLIGKSNLPAVWIPLIYVASWGLDFDSCCNAAEDTMSLKICHLQDSFSSPPGRGSCYAHLICFPGISPLLSSTASRVFSFSTNFDRFDFHLNLRKFTSRYSCLSKYQGESC